MSKQMRRLEHLHHISLTLLPVIIGKDHITGQSRLIFSMPAKYGGIGFFDPSSVSQLEYESSLQATSQLTDAIFQQQMTLRIDDEAQSKTMKEIKHRKDVWFKELQSRIRSEVSESQAKIIDLVSKRVLHLGSHPSHLLSTDLSWTSRCSTMLFASDITLH